MTLAVSASKRMTSWPKYGILSSGVSHVIAGMGLNLLASQQAQAGSSIHCPHPSGTTTVRDRRTITSPLHTSKFPSPSTPAQQGSSPSGLSRGSHIQCILLGNNTYNFFRTMLSQSQKVATFINVRPLTSDVIYSAVLSLFTGTK